MDIIEVDSNELPSAFLCSYRVVDTFQDQSKGEISVREVRGHSRDYFVLVDRNSSVTQIYDLDESSAAISDAKKMAEHLKAVSERRVELTNRIDEIPSIVVRHRGMPVPYNVLQ